MRASRNAVVGVARNDIARAGRSAADNVHARGRSEGENLNAAPAVTQPGRAVEIGPDEVSLDQITGRCRYEL